MKLQHQQILTSRQITCLLLSIFLIWTVVTQGNLMNGMSLRGDADEVLEVPQHRIAVVDHRLRDRIDVMDDDLLAQRVVRVSHVAA